MPAAAAVAVAVSVPIPAGDWQSPVPRLHALVFLQWYVQATCATQGTGLYDGLDWLSHELSKR